MKVWFRQCYIESGANFPFSHHFQKRFSREVTALSSPSAKFIQKYGEESELTFNVSAKRGLQDNELRGPTVFRKTKDVEYTVFLPFDVIMAHVDAPRHALLFLLKGVCKVFDLLEIDKSRLIEQQESLIDGICSDSMMLAEPSGNKEANQTQVRRIFTQFFEQNCQD